MRYDVGDKVITKYLPDLGIGERNPDSLAHRISRQECTVLRCEIPYFNRESCYVLVPDDESLVEVFRGLSFYEEWIEPIPVKALFVPKQEAILNFIM